MTLLEQSALMNNIDFRNRIKAALLNFAGYVIDEPSDTPAFNARRAWARNAQQSPDAAAQSITPIVVMDSAVQSQGAAIDDAALKNAVETVVKKSL